MDFEQALLAFEQFLQDYDKASEKIKLKEIHTYGVVEAATMIATDLQLSETDTFLAKLIALLHDIGRFEQAKRFNSFVDKDTVDHAEFGADILFVDGKIRNFIATTEYDELIEDAIRYHNKLAIPTGLTASTELHCKIIRDADKLDIFRVMITDSLTAFGIHDEALMKEEDISDEVFAGFTSFQTIPHSNRKTQMDFWIACVAFIFDFNFDAGLKIVQTKNYIDQLLDRVPSLNPKTIKQMETLRTVANEYVERKALKL